MSLPQSDAIHLDEYDLPASPLSPQTKRLLRAAAHLCNAFAGALKAFARELEAIAI